MFRLSFGSAVSAIALGSMLAGCASPGGMNRIADRNASQGKLGFATRAVVALNAGDFTNAIALAEQAAEKSPDAIEVRTLLANAYFSGGRFASAESAYRDALKLDQNQPRLILKLALVQIAQGKRGEALAFLDAARAILDPADYGLALALAGRPAEAVTVLDGAARLRGADARVRQNLALSHALAGDWTAARTVAAQDVPADQLDQRIQDWMRLANPARPTDQIAALTGVTPAPVDPGQPVRLAIGGGKPQTAVAQSKVPPSAVAPTPVAAVSLPVTQQAVARPAFVAPLPAPVQTAAIDDEPFVEVPPARAALAPRVKPAPVATAAAPRPIARAASFVPARRLVKQAVAQPSGKSSSVVQLGAYGSPQRVAAAWNHAARRYSALRAYMPVSARFQSSKGVFYRLSVKGFRTPDQAKNLCIVLRRSGGSCFVRNVAGDAPVQLALR